MEKLNRRRALAALAAAVAGVAALGARAFAPLRGGAQGVPAREAGGGRSGATERPKLGPAPGSVKRRG